MTQKELIDTLEIAAAEVEWNYPIDYAIAFEKAINYIKAWDNLKEKINQLQTYKLFQNDKETYLNKQDIIDLVSEIEREVNNEQTYKMPLLRRRTSTKHIQRYKLDR